MCLRFVKLHVVYQMGMQQLWNLEIATVLGLWCCRDIVKYIILSLLERRLLFWFFENLRMQHWWRTILGIWDLGNTGKIPCWIFGNLETFESSLFCISAIWICWKQPTPDTYHPRNIGRPIMLGTWPSRSIGTWTILVPRNFGIIGKMGTQISQDTWSLEMLKNIPDRFQNYVQGEPPFIPLLFFSRVNHPTKAVSPHASYQYGSNEAHKHKHKRKGLSWRPFLFLFSERCLRSACLEPPPTSSPLALTTLTAPPAEKKKSRLGWQWLINTFWCSFVFIRQLMKAQGARRLSMRRI